MTTTIKTADLHLELPRPWPTGCTGGPLVITTDVMWADPDEPHFGYLGEHGPVDRRSPPTDFAVLGPDGKPVPAAGRSVFGTWDTLDEACDEAWRALAAALAGEAAARAQAAIESPAMDALQRQLAMEAEARRLRAVDLHQCPHCRTTFKGQAPAHVVLEEHTLVELEDAGGRVLYAGPADGWGPALAGAAVTRARAEIEEHALRCAEQVADAHAERDAATRDLSRLWTFVLTVPAIIAVIVYFVR